MSFGHPLLAGLAIFAWACFAEVRRQPIVYEISTRPWLYALAQSGIQANCGEYVCLRDVPQTEWQRMKDDSIDMVWLMGVWQLGSFGVQHDRAPDEMRAFSRELPDIRSEDVIGSPYAVVNYTVNSDIGNDDDLAAVRRTLNELGMKLMLDFVPNHGAVDSVLVESNPGLFIQKPGGSFPGNWFIQREGKTYAYGRGPYDGPWTDTLNYNYWNPATVRQLTDVIVSIAARADAIRCDMAMLILNPVIERTWGNLMRASGFSYPSQEFWSVAIDAARAQFPGTLFMAEAYDYNFMSPSEKPTLQNLGFDFVYDKDVLDNLNGGNLDAIRGYIRSRSQPFFEKTAHFVENHDEPRSAASLGGQQQAFIGSVVASTLPGLRLFYFGQFDGFSAKLDVQLRRATKQVPNADLHARYTTLLRIISDDVFHTGIWTFVNTPREGSAWRVSAWRWASADGSKKRLIVVNFSDQAAWAQVQVADALGNGGSDMILVKDLLTDAVYQRSASELRGSGLNVGLQPWSASIFDYSVQVHKQTPVLV
eukprot:TRINITY_DN1584_c0_g1_i3.p1 TRINITY_DN1584_c0_g1~~TRINITY_DN1584_c0_g1_i3.p1  ORF type:complete len:535 (+),score=103.23 TRINITY_DN1584_c0_g1_i3:65-1669(+)